MFGTGAYEQPQAVLVCQCYAQRCGCRYLYTHQKFNIFAIQQALHRLCKHRHATSSDLSCGKEARLSYYSQLVVHKHSHSDLLRVFLAQFWSGQEYLEWIFRGCRNAVLLSARRLFIQACNMPPF